MKTWINYRLSIFLVFMVCATAVAENWPRFRGPDGSGVSASTNVPTDWSDHENIKWKAPLPGPGGSSPIIFGDRVYLTYYTGYGVDKAEPGEVANLKRHLACYNKADGQVIWDSEVDSLHDEDPYAGFITEHGYASCTPVTDGERIFVLFGKTGVAAFGRDGQRLWLQNVGTDSDPAKWGNGGSCIEYKDLLVVNAANMGHAIVALRKEDGSVAWKFEDEELTNCWSTPIVVSVDGHDELVSNLPGKILALDPATGEELWFADSPIANTTCASLAQDNGVVFAMGGRGGKAIGVRCGGKGDVSESHTIWLGKLRAGIGTPVVKNGRMYWMSRGIAYCASCETGDEVYEERLPALEASGKEQATSRPKGSYASAVAVGEKVLLTTRSGTTYFVEASATFKPINQNSFTEDSGPFNGTPAISENELFLRSNKMLYCVSESK